MYTLIIHGYSDCSKSFRFVKERLQEADIGEVDTILYTDYESREDNITFNDIIDGLNDELIRREIIDADGKKKTDLNIVVHSTGGLVIRHWIWRYYSHRMEECPVKRLVMLAPANFGSPLAHRGKSFLGKLVKGRWKIGDFLEVGRNLLNGLELGSPYQWELAHRDLLNTDKLFYDRHGIQLTILVGIEDYKGLRGWVNKPGTDGTVVIAGTALNAIKLKLDFSNPSEPHKWELLDAPDDFAFGVLENLDHGSIVDEFENPESEIAKIVKEALKVSSAQQFEKFKEKLTGITKKTYQVNENGESKTGKYQQFIIRAVDDHGAPVHDFTIEFYIYKIDKAQERIIQKPRLNNMEEDFSKKIHRELIKEIHTNTTNTSFRRLLVNVSDIREILEEARKTLGSVVLSMKIYVPRIDDGIRYNIKNLQNIVIYSSDETENNQPSFFFENTTTLIELKVDRLTHYVKIREKPK